MAQATTSATTHLKTTPATDDNGIPAAAGGWGKGAGGAGQQQEEGVESGCGGSGTTPHLAITPCVLPITPSTGVDPPEGALSGGCDSTGVNGT